MSLDQAGFPVLADLSSPTAKEVYYLHIGPQRHLRYAGLVVGALITIAKREGEWREVTANQVVSTLQGHACPEDIAHCLVSLVAIARSTNLFEVVVPDERDDGPVRITPRRDDLARIVTKDTVRCIAHADVVFYPPTPSRPSHLTPVG